MAIKATRFCVGIDMSKPSFQVCLLHKVDDLTTKVKGSRKFKNTPAGFRDFLVWLKRKIGSLDCIYRLFIEVTGTYHEKLLHFLYGESLPASLVLGSRSKAFMKATGYKSKNDKIDAHGLALMAFGVQSELWKPVSSKIIEIRNAVRLRNSLIDSKTAFKNRKHAMSYAAIPTKEVIECVEEIIKDLEEKIKLMEDLMISLCREDAEFFEKIEMIVNSKPGIGMITVINVVSETNGFSEFRSIKQLESYAGFDVVENQSGNFYGKTRMSKKGNKRLRSCLFMPSLVLIRNKIDPYYSLYERIRVRNPGKGKGKIGLVAVQRKMLGIIYTLWNKNEPFDKDHYQKRKDEFQGKSRKVVLA